MDGFVPEPQPRASGQVWSKYHKNVADKSQNIILNHVVVDPEFLSLDELDLEEQEWIHFDGKSFGFAKTKRVVNVTIAGYRITYNEGARVYLEFVENADTGTASLRVPVDPSMIVKIGGGARSKTRQTRHKARRTRHKTRRSNRK
jgi:hypothetical protein